MTTVVKRTFRSFPHRDAAKTWYLIVNLLTQGKQNNNYQELMTVSGIASSLITDMAMKDAPIIVTSDGLRTRIYCLYNDEAIDGSDANEDALSFNPLEGDWQISMPCLQEELSWVQKALKKHSSKITARDSNSGISLSEEESKNSSSPLTLDLKGFLKP